MLHLVTDKCEFAAGNLTDKVEGTYNIVVANIVADAIIMLSKDVRNFMNEDSVYIMSGIIESRLPDVLNALEGSFTVEKTLTDGGWVCLVAKAL